MPILNSLAGATARAFGMQSEARFTPMKLFAAGEQGVWYDPSDFSTMFQDAAGTTPVTAIEQPVGKILDKSGRGNHATQSTTTARPILRNRYNLLTYTEQFDNAVWVKTNTSIGANVTDPIGTTTAKTLTETATTADHYVSQQVGSPSAIQYTFSIYAKANTRRYFWLILVDGSALRKRYTVLFDLVDGVFLKSNSLNTPTGTWYDISNAGGGWWRMSITMTMANVANNVFAQFGLSDSDNPTFTATGYVTYTGDGTSGVYIWGASIVSANESTIPYQWVTTGAQSTSNPVSTVTAGYNTDTTLFKPFLAFDGTDDFLVTSSINFSATDKMSVFAGVRKLSDATGSFVAELSAGVDFNNGTFAIFAPGVTTTDRFRVASRGDVIAGVAAIGSTYAAPITSVLTMLSDIGGDSLLLNVNGVLAATSSGDQGTGSFGNYPLYIGRRGGTSRPLNGRIYSFIVRGALTTSPHLEKTEQWINQRTGAY